MYFILSDNLRLGIMIWGFVRKLGGKFVVIVCLVMVRWDYKLVVFMNNCVELK